MTSADSYFAKIRMDLTTRSNLNTRSKRITLTNFNVGGNPDNATGAHGGDGRVTITLL